ncbi:OstA-like protein [Sediminibacterium ginsengisoli]|uniref:OstA-like protein n=2 Tax=Sediminibacterium ginsengisoli TaxID=413434 RepID=A0A1T4P5S0_9BACT|nr:OstA-like protein [Sediminibacterium ginsengisoli]
MYRWLYTILLTASCVFAGKLSAQQTADTTQPGNGILIEFISAERYNVRQGDTNNLVSLAGKVHMVQGKTHFYADSVLLDKKNNTLEAFGNAHINDADSIHTYAQYMKYLGNEKKAFLKKKVKLTDGKGTLTTEELEYDVSLKIGTYLKGGKVVNKKTVLTSTEGYYYGDTKDVHFKKKVVLNDPEYRVLTDTLFYNTNTEITTLTSPSTIYNESRIIKTRNAIIDIKNKKATMYERSVIDDSTYTITADDMAFDDTTGMNELRGNVVYHEKDTAKGVDMIANHVMINRKKDILLATEKPVLLIKQNRDSIFITADTLYSARLSELQKLRPVPSIRDSSRATLHIDRTTADSSNDKYFEAYYNVRIYSDSLQATGDSLFYALQDSVFRLFKQPIVWAQSNQLNGDTIYLYIKNKKPERVYVFNNGIGISRVDSAMKYYNQLKGYTINALFEDGKINFMRAKGNAENIYYGIDDNNKFIGVSRNQSDVIEARFKEGKPQRITFINKLEGTAYPMRQVNHEELRLRGFIWQEAKRPKSKFDILSN